MSEGWSAGGAEIKIPRAEKQKAAIIVPRIRGRLKTPPPNKKTPNIKTKATIARPKRTEPIMSPRRIAQREIGEEIKRSKVFILVSQGAMTGVMAETEKKRAIPTKPGNKNSKEAPLLKEKERNKKAGINRPWIITGPRR